MRIPDDKYFLIARFFGRKIHAVVNTCSADGLETMLEKVKEYSYRKPGTYILFEYSGSPIAEDSMVAYVKYIPIVGALDGKTIDVSPSVCTLFNKGGLDFVLDIKTGSVGVIYQIGAEQ